MGDGKMEENAAVRMRCCERGVWVGWVGGWVGGWEGVFLTMS